ISRKDEIFVSDTGLVSMAGGKLTGYRKMAEEVVDKVTALLKNEKEIIFDKKSTVHLTLSGGHAHGSKGFGSYSKDQIQAGKALGLSEEEAASLVHRYGTNVEIIYQIIQTDQVPNKLTPAVYASL